jgi:dolichyl-phosphate beta-glucosyltransferase
VGLSAQKAKRVRLSLEWAWLDLSRAVVVTYQRPWGSPEVLTTPVPKGNKSNVQRRPYLSIVVPAYNEASSINHTLASMRAFLDAQPYDYQVILASDGDDATAQIAAEASLTWPQLQISAQPGRHGKGHGIRRGVALASGEVIGFLDADYKTPIEEVTKILPWLTEGFDVVIGSRGMATSRISQKQPWFRRIGSRGFGIVMHAVVGLRTVRDTQCGFKFFSAKAAADVFPLSRIDGYMCDVEYLWLAERFGYRIKEVGINWSDDGDSRLELFRGNVRNCRELMRIRFGKYATSALPTAGHTTVRVANADR